MSNFQDINASASPEVQMNENMESIEYSFVYGKRQPVTTGLTWGYWGGRWGGLSVAAGTLTLTDAATNYVVVLRSTGAISVSTASTNWDDTALYARVYKLTTAGGVVTAVEDHRAGRLGVHGSLASVAGPVSSTDGLPAVWDGTGGQLLKDSTPALIRAALGLTGIVNIIGSSAVPVSAPADTAENILATITVPANAMGANGTLRIWTTFSFTNGADDKIMRVRFSGAAGTEYTASLATTSALSTFVTFISNRNATNSQVSAANAGSIGLGTGSSQAVVTSAVDTTAETTIVITGQKETGGDTLTLQRYLVELIVP